MEPIRCRVVLLSLLCVAALASACASTPVTHRMHAEFGTRFAGVRTAGLAPPDIKIYQLSAGGVRELKDDWSEAGKKNVVDALLNGLKARAVECKALDIDPDLKEEMQDVQALYEAVGTSVLLHMYLVPFPHKQRSFDYSVGPVAGILDRYRVDALIFVYGTDEISSGGRKALGVLGVLAAAAVGGVAVPQGGLTTMTIAVVDRSGTVLWFNVKGGRGAFDLRDPGSTSRLVQALLTDLPPAAR
jgi:hypothetical protein